MGWDTEWQIEGFFYFGAPLNIWKFEVYQEPTGYQPLGYHRIHMQIDDDPELFSRLMALTNTVSLRYFDRLILMNTGAKVQYPHEYWLKKAWIYSLETGYRPSQYPYDAWKGYTLGVACDNTPESNATVGRLPKSWGSYGYEAEMNQMNPDRYRRK
jgi:hypothetical protein